ncbi:hypothetical protein ZWY2020_021643 [Hordeum vulgare]|nr:hypothetical protein ZWY2020_021643 [Hordeum vulgare]
MVRYPRANGLPRVGWPLLVNIRNPFVTPSTFPVSPFSAEHQLNEAFTGLVGSISMVDRSPIDMESDTENKDTKHLEGSEDDEDDEGGDVEREESEEEHGDEAESLPSDDVPVETRSKARQAHGVRGGAPKTPLMAKPSASPMPTHIPSRVGVIPRHCRSRPPSNPRSRATNLVRPFCHASRSTCVWLQA